MLTAAALIALAGPTATFTPKDQFDEPPSQAAFVGQAFHVQVPARARYDAQTHTLTLDLPLDTITVSRPNPDPHLRALNTPLDRIEDGIFIHGESRAAGSAMRETTYGVRRRVRFFHNLNIALIGVPARPTSLTLNAEEARLYSRRASYEIEGEITQLFCGHDYSEATLDNTAATALTTCAYQVKVTSIALRTPEPAPRP